MVIPGILSKASLLQRTLELLAADRVIDIIILHVPSGAFAKWQASWASEFKECVLRFNGENWAGKPVIIALHDDMRIGDNERLSQELSQCGITTYASLRDACRALNRFASYRRFIAVTSSQS
jgi:acyl-CoA synthetase (NDP forming)